MVISPITLRQVGLRSLVADPGTLARIGLYDVSRNLIAATGPVPVIPGRNLYPLLSALPLAAGPIWIITVFDRRTSVYGRGVGANTNYFGLSTGMFSGPLPAMLPIGSVPNIEYSQFLLGFN